MLDRLPRHKEFQNGFRQFCEKLLTREGFIVLEAGWKQKTGRAPAAVSDFILKRPQDSATTAVEAKFYRSAEVDPLLLSNALDHLKAYREQKRAQNAILIVTADLPPAFLAEAEKAGVELWTLPTLVQMTAKTPSLAEALADLLRDAQPGADGFAEALAALDELSPRAKTKGEGQRLATELDLVKPGREGSRKLDQVAEKAIRFLFGDQFQRWTLLAGAPEEGALRPLLLARAVPRHAILRALLDDLQSRYVSFAVDNSGDPVGAGPVYAIARHLHRGAGRAVAIFVTRAGGEPVARRAAVSLLREEGKLILAVSLAELKEMLLAKDRGDDFADLLFDRANDLLTDLS